MKMTIVQKLVVVLVVCLASLFAVSGTGIWSAWKLHEQAEDTYKHNISTTDLLVKMRDSYGAARVHLLSSIAHDPRIPVYTKHDHPIAIHSRAIEAECTRLESMVKEAYEDDPKKFGTLNESVVGFTASARKAVVLIDSEKYDDIGAAVFSDVVVKSKALTDEIARLVVWLKEDAKRDNERNNETVKTMTGLIVAIAALMCFALSVIGYSLSRRISRGFEFVSNGANKMSVGDLTFDFSADNRGDEISALCTTMSTTAIGLREIVTSVSSAASVVNESVSALEDSAEQLSAATIELSSQIATVATSAEEMSATSNDIAQNCTSSAGSASEAAAATSITLKTVSDSVVQFVKSAENIDKTSAEMNELAQEIASINVIVETIADVADSTNLLALNAKIESARAGELGRGFAVVADEVKSLAEKSASQTEEIEKSISEVQQRTKKMNETLRSEGAEAISLAEDAKKSVEQLETVESSVTELSMQISQIATAAEEQTATTNAVSDNIQQMALATEEASKVALKVSEDTKCMSRVAVELSEIVSRFKL